jgi:Protein of unknown function (DUF3630)
LNQSEKRLELQISNVSDWNLFNEVASVLQREFNAIWTVKLDGLDQRYWDLQVDKVLLTLHLEHYLGITLFPANEEVDTAAVNAFLNKVHNFLIQYKPVNPI